MNVDDPRTTLLLREIIQSNGYLKRIYCEWYRRLTEAMQPEALFLELGSGAGFFREFAPNVITSEVLSVPGVNHVIDARHLPFSNSELDEIVMTDVLHHIADVVCFFREATRCVKAGGQTLMVEPWNTPWSRWVNAALHSESFLHNGDWIIPGAGALSNANGALLWILFARDRKRFEYACPEWCIKSIELMMPLSYLLSGGVSLRALCPEWMYRPVGWLEDRLKQERWAMIALIKLQKRAMR